MRTSVFLLVLGSSSLGLAQEPPAETTTPATSEPPVTTTEATTSEASPVPGAAVGIGAGWRFPGGDIQVPNTASVRFRLGPAFTIEALAHVGFELTTSGPETNRTTQRALEVSGSGLARIRMAHKSALELALLLGAELSITSSTNDPDGADNETTSTGFGVSAVWGLGIDWFFLHNVSFSMSAVNPAVSFSFSSTDGPIDPADTSTTNIKVAAIFEPVITAMFHIYF